MAQTIKLKRSASQGAVPSLSSLELGEVAINTNDGAIYIKRDDGSSPLDILAVHHEPTMHIDYTNNRIGIGTSTPGEALEVVGKVEADEFLGPLRGAILFSAQADEALAAGDVVYISGISGNITTVAKADADDAAKMPAFGLALTSANLNAAVEIVTFGTLSNINTSTFTEGDELFVDTTAGGLVNTPPTGESAQIQKVAKVTRSDASVGSVKVLGAGRSNATPNLNTGRLFVGNASNQTVADDTVYVDIANSRVGIGTTSPSELLEVSSATGVTSINPTVIRISTTNSAGTWDDDATWGALQFYNADASDSGAKVHAQIAANTASTTGGVSDMVFGLAKNTTGTLTEIMRLTYQGNVGIGTTSPSYPLQVRRAGGAGSLGISIDNVGSTDRTVQYFSIQDSATGAGAGHAFYYRPQGSTTDTFGFMLDESGQVGIGTTSPSTKLEVANNSNATTTALVSNSDTGASARANLRLSSDSAQLNIYATSAAYTGVTGWEDAGIITTDSTASGGLLFNVQASAPIRFMQGATNERMRLDSSGNLLVGKTSGNTIGTAGIEVDGNNNRIMATRDGNEPLLVNRLTSDGALIDFKKDSATVGIIGSNSGSLYIADDDTGLFFNRAQDNILPYRNDSGNEGPYDAALDLGRATARFKDFYLSGSIQGPSTFYIDPSPDDTGSPGGSVTDTGTVVILGDLQVTGTTTTVNSTEVNIGDKLITLGADATADSQNDGAGIRVLLPDSSPDAYASITWNETNQRWDINQIPQLVGNTIQATARVSFLNNSAAQGIAVESVYAGTSYSNTAPSGMVGSLNGFQVGGTTFIDSSRNMSNLGDVEILGSLTLGNNSASESPTQPGDLRIYDTGNNALQILGNGANSFLFDLIGTTAQGSITFNDFDISVDGNVGIGTASPGAKLEVAGTAKAPTFINETSVIGTAAASYNLDATDFSSIYVTADATANVTVNVRGDASTTLDSTLAVGDTISVEILLTNGATAYYNSALQIDGVAQTVDWVDGIEATTGTANEIDAYQYQILKTATNTYTVIGSFYIVGGTAPKTFIVSSGTSGDATLIIEADTDNNDENDNPRLWFKQDGGIIESAVQMSNNTLDIINNVTNSGGIRFLTGTTDNTGTTDPATGATEAMRVTSAGNVGIGVTLPTYRIEAAATSGGNGIKITRGADSFFEEFQSTTGGVNLAASGSGAYMAFRTGTTAGTTTESMRIDSSGNVGIGTNSPDHLLHLYKSTTGNTEPHILIDGPANSERAIIFADAGADKWWIGRDNSGTVASGWGFYDHTATAFAAYFTDNGIFYSNRDTVINGTLYTEGSDSLTPDATQPGAIVLANGGSQASPSTAGRGVEFLTADANSGYGHRLVSFDNTSGDTPLLLQRRNNAAAWTTQITFQGNSNAVDINGDLSVQGTLTATSKSFDIEHPTKPNHRLRYGSLEGPENGVYVRGRLSGTEIELPEYWTALVDPDSITVSLTPIGPGSAWVEKIENNKITVGGSENCFYHVFAERVDIDKLVVEYEK